MRNGQKVKNKILSFDTCPMQLRALCMQMFWLEVLLYTLVFDDFTKHDIPFGVKIIFRSVNVKKRKEKKRKEKISNSRVSKNTKGIHVMRAKFLLPDIALNKNKN